VKLVRKLSCPSCDLTVYNLRKEGMDEAKKYGVNSVPTVVVDGKIAECCVNRKPTEGDLKGAGIGTPLE
jgi:protein-disulfide isomerase